MFNTGGGSLFGTSTTSSGSTFNFGQSLKTLTTTTASTGFNFGAGAPATTASGFTGFGGLLGSKTSASTGFGFGTTTTVSSGLPGFSGFGTTTTAATTASTGFNFAIGQPASSNLTLATNTTSQNNQAGNTDWTSIATAVSVPVLFGDERDTVVARWNQLQAFWGMGKGFFNSAGNFATFAADNPFCRFKTVGYSVLSTARNEDGLVGLMFGKSRGEVEANQTPITDALQKLMGAPQNYAVCVDSVKELPENKCEMIIYLLERPAQGSARKIPAMDLAGHLNQAHIGNQLRTQLAVENLLPKLGLSKEQLKQVTDTPPLGIDPFLWEQAKLDNPDPEKYVPVPMVGFKELNNRLKLQEVQTKLQQARLEVISNEISKLRRAQVDVQARIEESKRNQLELSHRVLKVMVRQEVTRKLGFGMQADEEQLRAHLESLQAELNAPTQFKGRLNELMSQLRMQSNIDLGTGDTCTHMDSFVQAQIGKHLKQQQEGLTHLIDIIKDDLSDLNLIETGLKDLH